MLNRDDNYRHILHDDESLSVFLRAMKLFDQRFCDVMSEGQEFTLRMEVHGIKGNLLHARVFSDGIDRPRGNSKSPRSKSKVPQQQKIA